MRDFYDPVSRPPCRKKPRESMTSFTPRVTTKRCHSGRSGPSSAMDQRSVSRSDFDRKVPGTSVRPASLWQTSICAARERRFQSIGIWSIRPRDTTWK